MEAEGEISLQRDRSRNFSLATLLTLDRNLNLGTSPAPVGGSTAVRLRRCLVGPRALYLGATPVLSRGRLPRF